ncbi:MAG: dTDP-glucose 4,6-dehydratase [Kiritimatiellae bacterium]|jgi:dTDP-glucose 4,6-dehydratase|nr:dTDP-glucose 4,6-dehydratase [Kiritimatiellia bacterium]MDY0150408.1 dTDP-glucose 4,6-dehydratase [Kiritimatiellia bacterium]
MPRPIQNLLVTGGAGFIGVNFIRWLFNQPDGPQRIINFDKLTYAGNPLSLLDLAETVGDRYVFIKADICDAAVVHDTIEKYQIDAIAHFAAESHVDRSIVAPDEFVRTNILGTYTLLQAAREAGNQIKLFHHVSTDEVFGTLGDTGFFTEDTPYAPNSPYSASKASSDHLVRAYHETYGLPTTLSNCSNNYGPFQFPEKLIPLMILNALEGKPLPVYGDGLHVRDWLFVTDHCAAIWRVMQEAACGTTYNVGGHNELPNLHVVEKICDLVDAKAPPLADGKPRRSLITYVKDRPGHDRRYAIDCSKIERDLSWTPAETFSSGFERTVAWYLENATWCAQVRSGDYQKWIATHYA